MSIGIGMSFHVRPDGQSAMAVLGNAIPAGSTVLWNNQPLQTSGGGAVVAAVVPAALYASPGTASIQLKTPNGDTSNSIAVTVYDKTGPAPVLVKLYPSGVEHQKGLQADGQLALGMAGTNFLPGATVLCDGEKLTTVFAKGNSLSALVPKSVITRPGSHQIWASNPDGKLSNKLDLTIAN